MSRLDWFFGSKLQKKWKEIVENPEEFQKYVSQRYTKKDFKPIESVVIYNERSRVLVVEDAEHGIWALPQRAIPAGQSLESVFYYILSTRFGIRSGRVHDADIGFAVERLEYEKEGQEFAGEEYFFSVGGYSYSGQINLCSKYSKFEWLTCARTMQKLTESQPHLRKEKISMIRRVLKNLQKSDYIV